MSFFYINNFIICCMSHFYPYWFHSAIYKNLVSFFLSSHTFQHLSSSTHTVFICGYSNCLFTFYKPPAIFFLLSFLSTFVFQILAKTIYFYESLLLSPAYDKTRCLDLSLFMVLAVLLYWSSSHKVCNILFHCLLYSLMELYVYIVWHIVEFQ